MIALLRQRNFALLWWGSLISMLGDWMMITALPIYVYQLTGSPLATSLTLVVRVVPSLLFGSVAGVFVDRWDRQRVMVITNLLLALTLLPLALVRSADMVWVVYVVGFLQTLISLFFGPAEDAFLPLVVGEEHLLAANGLNSLNNNLARLIGPPLGGFVMVLWNLGGVALADAATFLAAMTLIALVKAPQLPPPAAVSPQETPWLRMWTQLGDGVRLLAKSRVLVVMLIVAALSATGEGVFAVMFLVWVKELLGGGALELGWFYAAQGVGGILGGVVAGWVAGRLPTAVLAGANFTLFGLLDLLLFNYPRFSQEVWVGLAIMVLVGIPAVVGSAAIMTLRQLAVEDRFRGRIFGVFGTISALFLLISALTTGFVGGTLGPLLMLNIQGGAYTVAGLFIVLALYHVPENRPLADPIGAEG